LEFLVISYALNPATFLKLTEKIGPLCCHDIGKGFFAGRENFFVERDSQALDPADCIGQPPPGKKATNLIAHPGVVQLNDDAVACAGKRTPGPASFDAFPRKATLSWSEISGLTARFVRRKN
jgi:hypothetical protein